MVVGKLCAVVCLCAWLAVPALAGVYVSGPGSATVATPGSATVAGSPVHFVAKGTSPACAKGVTSMGVYTVPSVLAYTVKGSSLDTNLNLNPGVYNVAVTEWDNCGWSSNALLTLNVGSSTSSGTTFSDLQSGKGWSSYALLPPSWGICSTCTSAGPELKWSWTPNISSPSMDGKSTKTVYGGGTVRWGDVLWNNHIVGSFSSQGLPDYSHTLIPKLHNFTYSFHFSLSNASVSQGLEFERNQFTGGHSFIWGHECRIAGGHEWDVYDNIHHKWVPTGVPCNPVCGAWNRVIISGQGTSSNQLVFKSITRNGRTATLHHYSVPN